MHPMDDDATAAGVQFSPATPSQPATYPFESQATSTYKEPGLVLSGMMLIHNEPSHLVFAIPVTTTTAAAVVRNLSSSAPLDN